MLIEKRSFKRPEHWNLRQSRYNHLQSLLAYMTLHAQVCRTYKPYLETLLYVINFPFDPRIENGTIRKQQLETKVACCQDDNFRSYLDSSISYDRHALLINTCICMQSACLRATLVSPLFNKFSLIPTLLRITSIAYFGCRNHFRQTNLGIVIRSLAYIFIHL